MLDTILTVVLSVEMSFSSFLISHSTLPSGLCRSTSSLSQDLMLERFNRGKAKFDKPIPFPSPGKYEATPH